MESAIKLAVDCVEVSAKGQLSYHTSFRMRGSSDAADGMVRVEATNAPLLAIEVKVRGTSIEL